MKFVYRPSKRRRDFLQKLKSLETYISNMDYAFAQNDKEAKIDSYLRFLNWDLRLDAIEDDLKVLMLSLSSVETQTEQSRACTK